MSPLLSVLCVTKADPMCLGFVKHLSLMAQELEAECVIVADGDDAYHQLRAIRVSPALTLQSGGYLESIYDQAVAACSGEYIFRLDDDEVASPELVAWLHTGDYLTRPQWMFPRRHLWGDEQTYILNPPLTPDYQTRLGTRTYATRGTGVHATSPFGQGKPGVGEIYHYKFLIRTRSEREAFATRYEAIEPGAGRGKFLPFQLPEVAYNTIETASLC